MKGLYFSESHEWVLLDGQGGAKVGLSDYAAHELGDVVFINLPGEGDEFAAGEAFGDVESVKSVSELLSPVAGTVKAVNSEVEDKPGLVNDEPFETWLIELENVEVTEELMDEATYRAFCEKGE